MLPENNFQNFEALKQSCISICNCFDFQKADYQIGRSKIFLKSGVIEKLELTVFFLFLFLFLLLLTFLKTKKKQKINKYLFDAATIIAKIYRGWRWRKRYLEQKKATIVLQNSIKNYLCQKKLLTQVNGHSDDTSIETEQSEASLQVLLFFFLHFSF